MSVPTLPFDLECHIATVSFTLTFKTLKYLFYINVDFYQGSKCTNFTIALLFIYFLDLRYE